MKVIVYDPFCGFDNEELIIGEVTFIKGDQGTTTELRVAPADAYLPEPAAAKTKKAKKEIVF
nr:hypothetical protein [Cronobacter sakazakii]